MDPLAKKSAWLSLIGFVFLTLLFRYTQIDTHVTALFFHEGYFPLSRQAGWRFIYHYGQSPFLVASALALCTYCLSYLQPSKEKWRKPSLYFLLVALLGAGLLVNILFKGLTGRPRPYECNLFGGMWEFHHPFDLGTPGRGRSFISGHSASGFFFLSLFFLWQGSKRWWSLAIGLTAGLLLSTQRVISGSHWLSDVLLCGLLMFGVSALLSPLLKEKSPRFSLTWLIPLAIVAALLSNPIYEEVIWLWNPASQPQISHTPIARHLDLQGSKNISYQVHIAQGDLVLQLSDAIQSQGISQHASGWGLLGSQLTQKADIQHDHSNQAILNYRLHVRGPILHLKNRVTLVAPFQSKHLDLSAEQGTLELNLASLLASPRALQFEGSPLPITLPLGLHLNSKGFLKKGLGTPIVVNYRAKALRFQ